MLKRWIVATFILLFDAPAMGWSDHAGLLWPLVRTMPVMLAPSLQVETLEDFLDADAQGLEGLLAAHEARAREEDPDYAHRPDQLAFSSRASDLRSAFLRAIRVNPTLPYALYRQNTVEDAPLPGAAAPTFSDLSFLAPGVSHRDVWYLPLAAGDRVAPAHVLASGSDEPDFGMDIGLFEDNGTVFGKDYGFGVQPFGNPNLDYGSQAPFHMGFYHLDWLTRTAQPGLLRTFPAERVALFRDLASFAFSTGHDYWGWRFMGWGLHYVGDLTQPYHAAPLPGVTTAEALWTVMVGETESAVQLVSNRHGVLESYQNQRVMAAQRAGDWSLPLLAAIASGEPVSDFDASTVRMVLSAESVAAGAALDSALETHVPVRFVGDPTFEWTGSGEEAQIVDRVAEEGGTAAVDALDLELANQMRRFSRYARAWINVGIAAWVP